MSLGPKTAEYPLLIVLRAGLEPARLSTLVPKTSVATVTPPERAVALLSVGVLPTHPTYD
jgi:hypothetical protein